MLNVFVPTNPPGLLFDGDSKTQKVDVNLASFGDVTFERVVFVCQIYMYCLHICVKGSLFNICFRCVL